MRNIIIKLITFFLVLCGVSCCFLFFECKEWGFEKIFYLIIFTFTLTAPALFQIESFLNNKNQ